MEIALNCTRFSRALLLSRYGEEPIRVERADVLYTQLQSIPARPPQARLQQASKTLPVTIRMEVSAELGRFLATDQRAQVVGLHLYRFHMDTMLTFAEAQHMAGVPAQAALRQFLHLHYVGEDELPLDTAYKAWQRRRQRQRQLSVAQAAGAIVRYHPGPQPRPSMPPLFILRAVAQVYAAPITLLVAAPIVIRRPWGNFCYHYDARTAAQRHYVQARAVYAYLLWLDGGLSTPAIATQHIRLDESQIRRLIRGVRFERRHSGLLAQRIAQCRALIAHWNGGEPAQDSELSSLHVHAV